MGLGRYWPFWATALVLGLVALYATRRDVYGLYQEYLRHEAEVQGLEKELESLKSEAAELEVRLEDLDTNSLELEAAIRTGKSYVREGETVYRVPLPGGAAPSAGTDPNEKDPEVP